MVKCCSVLMTRGASLDLTDTSNLLYECVHAFYSIFSLRSQKGVREW
jgi:hypothetical protein